VISSHGLLTTIAYKIGKHSDPIYALEGSVTVSDYTTEWLKGNLWVMDIQKSQKAGTNSEEDSNKIHFVPAFSELYAPYWNTDANGLVPVILCAIPSYGHYWIYILFYLNNYLWSTY